MPDESNGLVVAYDIQWGGRRHLSWERPSEHWNPQPESVVPLYSHPCMVLTAEEREAIHWVVGDVADITGPVEETLRGLLERTKQQ